MHSLWYSLIDSFIPLFTYKLESTWFEHQQGDQLHKDHRSKRVISNKYATPHSRPWMVILTRDGNVSCGAALINRPPYHTEGLDEGSSDMLLTAAHCVIEMFEE
uniref:Peptidase S1 domain-containing protein n=1 Tax=Romanomermis culicivorax TaxID=13658 RepID=A0A915K2T3_ROMCU